MFTLYIADIYIYVCVIFVIAKNVCYLTFIYTTYWSVTNKFPSEDGMLKLSPMFKEIFILMNYCHCEWNVYFPDAMHMRSPWCCCVHFSLSESISLG
jgi:hypothetical protein